MRTRAPGLTAQTGKLPTTKAMLLRRVSARNRTFGELRRDGIGLAPSRLRSGSATESPRDLWCAHAFPTPEPGGRSGYKPRVRCLFREREFARLGPISKIHASSASRLLLGISGRPAGSTILLGGRVGDRHGPDGCAGDGIQPLGGTAPRGRRRLRRDGLPRGIFRAARHRGRRFREYLCGRYKQRYDSEGRDERRSDHAGGRGGPAGERGRDGHGGAIQPAHLCGR